MGWEDLEPARPNVGTVLTLSVQPFGKRGGGMGRIYFLSIPTRLAGKAWDGAEQCRIQRGTGENEGKIRLVPAPDGPYKARHNKESVSVRFPAPDKLDCREAEPIKGAVFSAEAIDITLPAWARSSVQAEPERPREGEEKAQKPAPAPEPLPPLPRREPLFQTPRKAMDTTPGSWESKANEATEAARKLPASKASATEPAPAWRGQPDRPVAKPVVKGKINLIGSVLEANTRVMSLKGADERLVMEHLVQNMDRRASTEFDTPIGNFEGVIKSLRKKLEERRVPLTIVQENGGYRLKWKEAENV